MSERVFEIRTYHVNPGKLVPLLDRFRSHSLPLFRKHGLEGVGYWTAREGDTDLLIYVLSHPSRDAAAANWKSFQADPAWVEAKAASHRDGVLVKSIHSVMVDPTDFSPIR